MKKVKQFLLSKHIDYCYIIDNVDCKIEDGFFIKFENQEAITNVICFDDAAVERVVQLGADVSVPSSSIFVNKGFSIIDFDSSFDQVVEDCRYSEETAELAVQVYKKKLIMPNSTDLSYFDEFYACFRRNSFKKGAR